MNSSSNSYDGGSEQLHNLCTQISTLLAALELCDVIGIPAAYDALNSASIKIPGAPSHMYLSSSSLSTTSTATSENESPRLMELLKEIRNASNEAKILVFVSTRETARVLCDILCKKFPKLNPLRVVGHGGYDGMDWYGAQEEALLCFCDGRSRLLVCTSVLEEGLDVPACDLVIRYYGSSSLIQFIQSRGRARKDLSHLITILSREHQHRVAELEAQERIMDSVIQYATINDNLPSKRCLELLDKAIDHDVNNVIQDLSKEGHDIILPKPESRAFSLRIYIDDEILMNDEGNLQHFLLDNFLKFGFLKIARIQCMNRKASHMHTAGNRIFKQCDSIILIGMKPLHNDLKYCLEKLCLHWNFQWKNRTLWIDISPLPLSNFINNNYDNNNHNHDDNSNISIPLITISSGYLLSKSEYDERFSITCHNMSFHKDIIIIRLHVLTIPVIIRIAISTLNNCGILSSDSSSNTCMLLLPLLSAPVIEIGNLDDEGGEEVIIDRVVQQQQQNLQHVGYVSQLCSYPVLCLRASIQQWNKLCSILSKPLLFGIPFFLGRVTCINGIDNIDEYIQNNISSEFINIKWSLGCLACNWNIIINPQMIIKLIQAITIFHTNNNNNNKSFNKNNNCNNIISSNYNNNDDIIVVILDQINYLTTNNSNGSIWDNFVDIFNSLKNNYLKFSPIQRKRQQMKNSTIQKDYLNKIFRILASRMMIKTDILDDMIRPFLVKPIKLQTIDSPLPDNYILLPNIILTPTRIIIKSSVVSQLSRFTRRFGTTSSSPTAATNQNRIILVRFRDEQQQDLHDNRVLDRIKILLINGIYIYMVIFIDL